MELTIEQEKKLNSIARRMQKASNEIKEMGFDIYLSAHGSVNIMNGDSHDSKTQPMQENVVFNFYVNGWDAGDW
jgi:hypothetical protein|tara:strand:+ start:353 stop:574 length:222 start_codon:yes stop_codon:yes gene_type:complete